MIPSQAAQFAPHTVRAGSTNGPGVETSVPTLPLGIIHRSRLLTMLTESRQKPLAIVVAPAGYGKSTLLMQWANVDDRPFIWCPSTAVGSELTQRVRAARAQHPSFVLVIDSSDAREPRKPNRLVSTALNELPAGATIALASRAEPLIALSRLRANRLLTEVRMQDLALTRAESEALLRQERITLPPEELDALIRRTEGWPAALYLAAVALRNRRDGVSGFTGQQHLMFEYLIDEVLRDIPGPLHEFAVRTSMFEELSGPLCDGVLDQHGSGQVLAQLARLSPLLTAVDVNDEYYRWHGLVRDALRSELHRSEPEQERELHRRASSWHAALGETAAAIDHAATACDVERTGDLLCDQLVWYLSNGRHGTIKRWLTAFNDKQVGDYAPLALSASFSCLYGGDADEAQRWATTASVAAERGRVGRDAQWLAAGLKVVQAFLPRAGVARMQDLAQDGVASEPEGGHWHPHCRLLLGVSTHLSGRPDLAAEMLEDTVAMTGNQAPSISALCLAQRVMIALEEREWEAAAEHVDRAMRIVERRGLSDDPASALVFAAAAASHARLGLAAQAKADLVRGTKLLNALGEFAPWYEAEALVLLAHASATLADIVGARTLLAEASRQARRTPDAVIFARWFDEAWAYMDTFAETDLSGPCSLTIAELRILRFLPSHRSFREIAAQLNLSVNTVKSQAHAVYRKLGVSSRSEAVDRAHSTGLLG